jgi:uncharacterized iron-regulated protein
MTKTLLLLLLSPFLAHGQKDAYQIYNSKEKVVKYTKLLKQAKEADVILFGEFHDNPIIHWLQLELTNDIYETDSNLVLGAEMMESDDQLIIDEYLAGYYNAKKFISESKTWPNFETDYLPLLEFAKANKLEFIATNIPRRYASMVYSYGIDTLVRLSEQAKGLIAPLPIKIDTTLASYQEMLAMGMGHGGANLPKSQAIKDATMAHFISQNIPDAGKFIHYHGAFHSKNYEGIYWYLKDLNPGLKVLTIGCEEQENISELNETHDKADFIIVIPTNMTKTH